jgi:hypothetical protein
MSLIARMASLQEMSAWSAEEAYREVMASMPDGWSFSITRQEGPWVGLFLDTDGGQVWRSEPSADPRIVLIESYVWIHIGRSEPSDPRWARRPDRPAAPPMGFKSNVPDPDDLNPEEIAGLYKSHS